MKCLHTYMSWWMEVHGCLTSYWGAASCCSQCLILLQSQIYDTCGVRTRAKQVWFCGKSIFLTNWEVRKSCFFCLLFSKKTKIKKSIQIITQKRLVVKNVVMQRVYDLMFVEDWTPWRWKDMSLSLDPWSAVSRKHPVSPWQTAANIPLFSSLPLYRSVFSIIFM